MGTEFKTFDKEDGSEGYSTDQEKEYSMKAQMIRMKETKDEVRRPEWHQ